MLIHVVRPGETVYAIARNYGVDPRRLMADNGVPADGALAVGQTLVLRFPNVVHAVRPNEYVRRHEHLTHVGSYGVSVRSLWRNNPELLGGSLLAPGQVLVITYHEEKLGTAVANGYAYPFLSPALLAGTAPFLSYLTPFTYGISRDLGLLPLRDGELLAGARAHGTGAVMHLSTYTEEERFDVQRAEQLLTDAAAQARLLGEIQRTMAEKGSPAWMWTLNTCPAPWRRPTPPSSPGSGRPSGPRGTSSGQPWPPRPAQTSPAPSTRATTTPG